MPGQNHRPLGAVNQLQRLLVLIGRWRQVRPISGQLRLDGLSVKFARGLLRILGDIHEHGTRPAGTRHIKCFADRLRNLIGMRDQIVVLGDGQRDARNVRLLKRVGTDELAAHLAGNTNDGRGIEHRRGDSGDHVRGARARKSQPQRPRVRKRARSHRPCASRPVRGAPGRDGCCCTSARHRPEGSRRRDSRIPW